MMIDTHCHINMMVKSEFDRLLSPQECSEAQSIINQAQDAGVSYIINVGTSMIESINCLTLAQRYPATTFAAVGIHPNDATSLWKQEITELEKLIESNGNSIVAVGECGLDYHYPGYNKSMQYDVFKAHIELALRHNKTLIVHTRDAIDDTMSILEPYKYDLKRTVIHCYSESVLYAQTLTEWGFYLGIDAPITYPKNQTLKDVVAAIDISSLVLETDAPFLPPQSMRGKKNHPAYLAAVAQEIAQIKQVSYEYICQQTTRNACTLFNLKEPSWNLKG